MGQQQLLYILLGILLVGVAIAISMSLFRDNAIESKRDVLITECISLAHMALEYYKKPPSLGGGGYSFAGWLIPEGMAISENGSFLAEVNTENVKIIGTGNEVVTGTDSIKVEVEVVPGSFSTKIIN